MPKTFDVTFSKTETYEEGYGVMVDVIYGMEDEEDFYNDRVADIDVSVIPIREEDVRICGAVPCLPIPEATDRFVPLSCFLKVDDLWEDDTHDLRTRWFATEDEANDHAERTRNRWERPQPWESFVKVS